MPDLPNAPISAHGVLELERRDPAGAAKAMAELDLDAQVALVCDAPVGRRTRLLELSPAPEELVPRLPEAELCFTVKAVGLESASWLLELATPEQIIASLDLDTWTGPEPDVARLDDWIEALATTSDDALHRGVLALDPELLVLYIGARVAVFQKPDDDEGWDPPDGSRTLDGQFHLAALRDSDDLAGILRILDLLFQRDYWTYFRLLQGGIWELPTENAEWALRWRTGRLQDLGFPDFDEAMGLYRYLSPEERGVLPRGPAALDVSEWHLPVWIPALPEGADSAHLLFRTLARLPAQERRAAFFAFVAVANKLAVADRMPLSDAETTPRAVEKAASWISRGLEHLANENGLDAGSVLRQVPLERLFRVGANLDPEAARK